MNSFERGQRNLIRAIQEEILQQNLDNIIEEYEQEISQEQIEEDLDQIIEEYEQEISQEQLEQEEDEVLFVPRQRTRRIRQRRRERREENSRTFNIIRDSDKLPVLQLYDKIKDLLGQRIRIITMDIDEEVVLSTNKSIAVGQLYEIFGIDSSTDSLFDKWFSENNVSSIPVKVILLSNVEAKRIEQKFAEGINHCLFNTVKLWATERLENSKGKSKKRNWITTINNIKKFEEKYKDGIPEENIQEVCDKLQINIQIVLPLLEKNLIECKSTKKALKSFKYINSKINHVDEHLFRIDDVEEVETGEQMDEIFNNIQGHKVWTKNKYEFTSILTTDKKYVLKSKYRQIVKDFEYESGLDSVKICDIKDIQLSKFVRLGVHYNTMINLNDDINYETEIKHIDMEKAYANYDKCRWYQGFCGKITDFRKTDRIVGVGLYRITDIDYTDCHERVKSYLVDKEVLQVYVNMNVYPSPELQFLKDLGVKFKILEGCWGNRIHFKLPKVMYEKDSRGIRHYCRYFGTCNSESLTTNIWMKGSRQFFENLKSYEGVHQMLYDDENKQGFIKFSKPYNKHSSHITAFITAYQRMSLFEQLFEYEVEEVYRIATDAIYSNNQREIEVRNVFRYEDKKMKKLIGSDKYLSNIHENLSSLAIAENRQEYMDVLEDDLDIEYHKGAGGAGKTYSNLTDKGFIRVLYSAPSHKLLSSIKSKHDVMTATHARLLMDDPESIGMIRRNANVIVVDEISMRSIDELKKICENYKMCKIILCGDMYQLPCIEGTAITEDAIMDLGVQIVKEYKTNYRIKDDRLLNLCNKIRDMMDEENHKLIIAREIKRAIDKKNIIKLEDLDKLYNIDDMILTCTNVRKDKITKMFEGKFNKEKYYIKDNNNHLYHTGDIVISDEKIKSGRIQHAFTVHSVQGETCENKLFIDLYRIASDKMVYTALSRARRLEQIYVIA